MEDFKADMKVELRNLTKWDLYFPRLASLGDAMIPAWARSYKLLTFEEIQMQIQTGNVMFTGTDGIGSHARIRIIDDAVRAALFGVEGDETTKVDILTLDAVRELLAIKNKTTFMKRLSELVVTDAEKRMIIGFAEEAGAENAEAWKIAAIKTAAGIQEKNND